MPMRSSSPLGKKILFPLSLLLLVIALLQIWHPEIHHNYVLTPGVSAEELESLQTRPAQAVLSELNQFSLSLEKRQSKHQILATAEEILRGRLNLDSYSAVRVSLPFSPHDLNNGSSTLRLLINGLIVPEKLLDAYAVSGDSKYLEPAVRYFVAWHEYESSAWFDPGFLWNDHAIASRIYVISKMWQHYRGYSGYQEKTARVILAAAKRAAQFLLDDGHFTIRTNHGVMQNLALLHLSAAMPALEEQQEYVERASERLNLQLQFYINTEGVVLEHSAGYHEIGVMLLGMAMRYMTILDLPISSELIQKYQKAKKFLSKLRRPDNTLPMYGNTKQMADLALRQTEVDESGRAQAMTLFESPNQNAGHFLFPVAGYSIQWHFSGTSADVPSQGVMLWSNYASQAHKHADELSFLLWADNVDWWTNVGYWPYGYELYYQANSWPGSNAPHVKGESRKSLRKTQLLYSTESDLVNVVDVERRNDDGFSVRRQLIFIKPDIWLVLDSSVDGKNRQIQHIWATDKIVNVENLSKDNGFLLTTNKTRRGLQVEFLGGEDLQLARKYGSREPFAGWLAADGVHETNAFVLENKANSWGLVLSRLVDKSTEFARMEYYNNSEDWKIHLSNNLSLSRNGEQILLSRNKSSDVINLRSYRDNTQIETEKTNINQIYRSSSQLYPVYKYLLPYRIKMSWVLLLVIIVQEVFFLGCRRVAPGAVTGFRIASLLIWLGICFWLPGYFVG